jgi:hypothetical protein
MNKNGTETKAYCRLCDWECFRDPSELFGPVLEGLFSPLNLLRRIKKDTLHFRLWSEDMLYYRACQLFNGRKPPDMARLSAFHTSSVKIP